MLTENKDGFCCIIPKRKIKQRGLYVDKLEIYFWYLMPFYRVLSSFSSVKKRGTLTFCSYKFPMVRIALNEQFIVDFYVSLA